ELEDPPHAAPNAAPSEELEHDVLRLDPVGQPPAQLDADDPLTLQAEAEPSHRGGDLDPARADPEHPDGAALRGVGVRAEQEPAGPGEPSQVHVVRDAVAGPREPGPEAGGEALQVALVVG